MLKEKWIDYFRSSVNRNSSMSKDVNTQVGAVIFSEEDLVEISSGWNDLPRGMEHSLERNSRPLKYKITPHAEMNAIVNAARMGRVTKGSSLIVNMFPCSMCAALIVNAGIKKVYSPEPNYNHVQYGEDFRLSEKILKECRVEVIKI